MSTTVTRGPHDRLTALGLRLPDLGPPAYAYEATTRHADLLYVSGQISREHDGTILTGTLEPGHPPEAGLAAARAAALNLLARIDQAVGLEQVVQLLKLNVWVSSSDKFTDQPAIAEGASQLLIDVLGAAGTHARTALPAPVLPKGALIELDAIVAVK
ncbi:YjgF translation initiation inhibitor [Mycobacterium sp. 852013-50091_SCH5140682]|uniref:RidA family protein n=1 Tax=Mycobacterium sp. 852013-50091_SCH5140682 TaxID=1834109 RepID=UPI0007EADC27|nr:RidA family protein [Mycobacterium sp. 852013-50091_SCH5140682]OBC01691.1 YjgF translation initiation inhibitor [Mycobacterium sp. 852013-50091_SCH5140682]